ncbi:MAG: hypothetical protein HY695_14630 [Deltaproteobacteria bacterium]|nr:hypothetical protein [Deltaproteobacteria bacterium]
MNTSRLSIVGALCLLTLVSLASIGSAADWRVPGDFATIQEAINSSAVVVADRILVGAGAHAGAVVTKSVEIKGEDGAVINSGPAHGSGLVQGFRFLAGSDGATISHLRFEVDLVIMNGAAVNDVTITQNTFVNAVQAVTNWRGDGWQITHNKIVDLRTRCGGGIGVLVGDLAGGSVSDNVVAHNTITGTLHVSSGDCGDYNGSGIVLYADFRWGAAGAKELAYNRIIKNKIALTSDTPQVVDVVAIELTDTRGVAAPSPVIFDNAIGFNDLRGTALQIDLTPDGLDAVNDISRNLGENRGHGLHPSVFGPGDN